MRQVCNVSYVSQAERFTDENELDAWEDALNTAPGEAPRRRTRIDPGLLGMIGGPGR